MIIIQALFWFLLAFCLAALEVEIEGKYGWAEKLPTWSKTKGFLPRLFACATAGNPLTGYHLFLSVIVISLFHLGFIQGAPWSIAAECKNLAIFFTWIALWDFLWFVINPYYGLINFRKEKVWWHSKSYWLFNRIPSTYLGALILSLLLALAASWIGADAALFWNHILLLSLFFCLTMLTIYFSPYYHTWYMKMRNKSESTQPPRKDPCLF